MATYVRVELLASAARASSNTSVVSGSQLLGRFKRATLLLDVTAAATAAGDLLDVYVQKNVGPPGTAVWHDFVHFTQVLGNGGAKQFVAQVLGDAVTTTLGAVKDGALAAGVEHGPWPDQWRIKWVIASASAPSFTFSVYGHFEGD